MGCEQTGADDALHAHAQQIVQSAHAVDDMNKDFPHGKGNYMVLCGVADETELLDTALYLTENDIWFTMFFEPDVGSHTAIATRPLFKKERRNLRKFKLKS